MAQNVLDKINLLISANLHAMVDSALEANSVKVMDEYIRRAEGDLDELEEATVTVGGSVRTLKRKADESNAAVEKLDRDIDMLLTKGNNQLASSAQTELNSKKQLAQQFFEQFQSQENEYKKMLDAKVKLETRLTTIKQEREHLQELMKLAEAKKATTKTIKSLNDIQSVGDEDVRRIGDAIRERLDREDADLEMASTRLQDQMDSVVQTTEVDGQLEERRKRLGLSS